MNNSGYGWKQDWQWLIVSFVFQALICLIDKKTNEKSKTRPRFVKQDQIAIVRLEVLGGMICVEPFKDFPQMGRFTLRDEGQALLYPLLSMIGSRLEFLTWHDMT